MESICAICGRPRREDSLVCPRCYSLYQKEAPARYRRTKEVLELVDWVEEKAQEKLVGFQGLKDELKAKEAGFRYLQDKTKEEEKRVLEKRLAGKKLPSEVLQDIRKETHKEVWQKMGGNRLYAELQTLREEVEEKTSALKETLQQIEEIKKERALSVSVDRLIKSVGLSAHTSTETSESSNS